VTGVGVPIGATLSPARKYSPTENSITPASNSQRTIRLGGSASSVERGKGDDIGRYSSDRFYIKEWHTILTP